MKMKKLEDFQAEKIETNSIYGGMVMEEKTRAVEKCQCSEGHWHNDHVYPDA
jgi:hypothetical protein